MYSPNMHEWSVCHACVCGLGPAVYTSHSHMHKRPPPNPEYRNDLITMGTNRQLVSSLAAASQLVSSLAAVIFCRFLGNPLPILFVLSPTPASPSSKVQPLHVYACLNLLCTVYPVSWVRLWGWWPVGVVQGCHKILHSIDILLVTHGGKASMKHYSSLD